jgi:hypothetical protein
MRFIIAGDKIHRQFSLDCRVECSITILLLSAVAKRVSGMRNSEGSLVERFRFELAGLSHWG